MLALFASAFGLGIAFCAPPGTVMSESIRRGLKGGFWATLRLQMGSLIGDATWAIIGLAGAGLLVQQPLIKILLMGLGAILLGYLACCAARDAWRGQGILPAANAALKASKGDFITGVLLSLTNPTSVAYWLALGGALAALGIEHPGLPHYAVFFVGFMIACLVWSFLTAGVIAWGRRLLNPRFYRWINGICAVLLGIAAIGVAQTVGDILRAG
ncbi:MAG TPA: LysE family transporter [Terriglobia bacterium]|nr:LysE family transporter [Terriglobia bacterium]